MGIKLKNKEIFEKLLSQVAKKDLQDNEINDLLLMVIYFLSLLDLVEYPKWK